MSEQPYEFRGYVIPARMMGGMQRYFEHGLSPGSFLMAVLCNDLVGAAYAADDENLSALPAYAAYLYNEAPSGSWGSRTAVTHWMSVKRAAGHAA